MMTGIGAYILISVIIIVNTMVLTLIYIIYKGSIKNIENLRQATIQLTKNHETFSAIAVAMDAKLNASIEIIETGNAEVSDILELLIPTARVTLEIKQLVSKDYSKKNPDEAHIEGKRMGASEEAMEQARAKIAADQKTAARIRREAEAEAEPVIELEAIIDPPSPIP